MFSRLSSAFNAVKEKATSFVSKVKETVQSYLPASVDPRPAVHARVMQTMQGQAMQKHEASSVRKAPIILEMPERRPRSAQARQPQSAGRGLFGIQTWVRQEDLSLRDPTSSFQDFGHEGMMDETPMTERFYEEVHMRAFHRGDHYYDPLYNYNHGLRQEAVPAKVSAPVPEPVRAPVVVSAPVASPVTAPTFAPIPVFAHSPFFQAAAANTDMEQGAQVIPFRRPASSVRSVPAARPAPSVADAWLMGDRAFEKARARTRDRVGMVLDRAA